MPIEPLEDRIAPATVNHIIVTNLHSSGPGSLPYVLQNDLIPADTNNITIQSNLHGKIVLQSALPVINLVSGETVTINGHAKSNITIDGNNHQIFSLYYYVNSTPSGNTSKVTISNFTLTRGSAQSSSFQGVSLQAGGALLVDDPGGSVTVSNCVITHNQAIGAAAGSAGSYVGQGGAIELQAGKLTVSGSTLSGNLALGTANSSGTPYLGKGGAIDVYSGSLTLSNSTITGNIAQGAAAQTGFTGGKGMGGAVYVGQYGTLSLSGTTLSKNKALGGAGIAGANGTAGASGSAGTDGTNGGYGGGGYGGAVFSFGALTIQKTTISGNTAQGGAGGNGGRGGAGGNGTSGVTAGAAGNGGSGGSSGRGAGGGVMSGLANVTTVAAPTLTIQNSTISGNVSLGGAAAKAGPAGKPGKPGGGTALPGAVGTAGTAAGGGVYAYGSYVTASQITVAKNSSQAGGGLYLNQDFASSIDNSTIAFNKASGSGGGLFVIPDAAQDAITLISTIVGQNTAHTDADVFGAITANYSLIQSVGDASITGTNNITGESPLLGKLANHGGSVDTLLPSKHSPVINAGFNPDSSTLKQDERGQPREIDGKIDIGAVEVG